MKHGILAYALVLGLAVFSLSGVANPPTKKVTPKTIKRPPSTTLRGPGQNFEVKPGETAGRLNPENPTPDNPDTPKIPGPELPLPIRPEVSDKEATLGEDPSRAVSGAQQDQENDARLNDARARGRRAQ